MVTHATGETGCCLHGPRRGVIKRRELGQPVRFESESLYVHSQTESQLQQVLIGFSDLNEKCVEQS
jgi:hypothetical protein